MEDFTVQLVPVAQWDFRLYRVVWSSSNHGETKTLFCVTTDSQIDEECQRRWPSDRYTEYMEYDMGEASRPPKIGEIHGLRIDEDGWTTGERLAKEK